MTNRTEVQRNVALLLWASEPEAPQRLAAPFFHASAAAAMDVEVEVYFTARSVLLLRPGVADQLYAGAERVKSIYAYMQEAVQFGARFYACSDALSAHGMAQAVLIPECRRRGGAVQFMARACDPRWATLVF